MRTASKGLLVSQWLAEECEKGRGLPEPCKAVYLPKALFLLINAAPALWWHAAVARFHRHSMLQVPFRCFLYQLCCLWALGGGPLFRMARRTLNSAQFILW